MGKRHGGGVMTENPHRVYTAEMLKVLIGTIADDAVTRKLIPPCGRASLVSILTKEFTALVGEYENKLATKRQEITEYVGRVAVHQSQIMRLKDQVWKLGEEPCVGKRSRLFDTPCAGKDKCTPTET